MKKFKVYSILLNVLEGVLICGIVLLVLGGGVILSDTHYQLLEIVKDPLFSSNSKGIFAFVILIGVIALSAGCFLLAAMKNLIHHLARGEYFVVENLKNVKQILTTFATITGLELIFSFTETIVGLARHQVKLDLSGVLVDLLILGAIYLIYLVFKHGIKLQEDVDQII